MPIRGILFDKDGTLLDYEATWGPINRRAALTAAGGDEDLARRLLVHVGYEPDLSRARAGSLIAAGTNLEIAQAFAALLPGSDPQDLLKVVRLLDASTFSSTPVTGVHAALTAFAARTKKLGVATHDSEAGIQNSLGPHGLLPYFTFLAGFDSGHGHKPGPGMLEAFCRATDLAAAEVCVVGDNRHDLDMGTSGGAALRVGVLTGTSTAADLGPFCDAVYSSVAEMAADPAFMARLKD